MTRRPPVLRDLPLALALGVFRGVVCGATLGALSGAVVVLPGEPVIPSSSFSDTAFLAVYAGAIGAVVGVGVGLACATTALLVLAVVGAVVGRRSRLTVAAAAGTGAATAVGIALAVTEGGVPGGHLLVAGLATGALSWWQVRRVMGSLGDHREG